MLRLAASIAALAGWLSRRMGQGGGTTLPGVVLLRLRPDAIAEYSNQLPLGTVLCSATNGKTTTTHLIVSAAEAAGHAVITNTEGSNLERGIAAAFVAGPARADLGIFEVDEAALNAVATAASPAVIVLMNLFRDQLDRYGELETLVDRWDILLDDVCGRPDPPTLVLNADDPNIAELGHGRANVIWFGLDDQSHALAHRAHAADATTCRRCGQPLEHTVVLLGHLGHWKCSSCDAARPTPDVVGINISFDFAGATTSGQIIEVRLPDSTTMHIESALPGLHNSYNLTAAAATGLAIANRVAKPLDNQRTAKALGATAPAFGRGEIVPVGDKSLRMLLAKNPTGVNQNVRTLIDGSDPDESKIHALVLLNDRTADGQDVSWIWDVDWEPLKAHLASLTLGGERAGDLALRFRYGGFDMDTITVQPNIELALDAALARTPPGETLHALPTYTAMLDLRSVLTDRGHTSPFWVEA